MKSIMRSNNPLAAWSAYRWARVLSEPIPEWVLSYFDRSIDAWFRDYERFISGEKPNEPARSFVEAFGINRRPRKSGARRGPGTVWSSDSDWVEIGSEIYFAIMRQQRECGTFKEKETVREVARSEHPACRPSFTTAWRAWQRFKKERPTLAVSSAQVLHPAEDLLAYPGSLDQMSRRSRRLSGSKKSTS